MTRHEFRVKERVELVKAILDELPFLSRWEVEKILNKKDIKVNNIKVKDDLTLNPNDSITIFYTERETEPWCTTIFEDENILIVNKRAGIEVVSETDRDLLSVLAKSHTEIYPVHRIDRNTEGLVVFALNKASEADLLSAFMTRTEIIKTYILQVHGKVELEKIKSTVYLKKVDHLSKVWISEVKTSGYDPITTKFSDLRYDFDTNTTLLQAQLVTGKTHQIRAHIAYYGYPILGDAKYGKDRGSQLHLTAAGIQFKFKKGSKLIYLNGQEFSVSPTWLA